MTYFSDADISPTNPSQLSNVDAFAHPASFVTDVIDSMAARIGVLDENDRFIAVNRAWKARAMTQGMPPGYPVGSHLHDLTGTIPRRYARLIERGYLAVVEGRRNEFSCAYPVQTRGEDDWFKQSMTRMIGDGPARYVVVIHSVQEIKRAERRLRALNGHLLGARALAEKASRAKSVFLSMMSHEMRTPLNGVLGMAELMALGELPGAQRRNLDVIQKSGRVLLSLLTDLLELSRLESGGVKLEGGVIDSRNVVDQVRAYGLDLLDGKEIALNIRVAEDASGLWSGDEKAVLQVLRALLSNAVKFTDRGEIAVGVSYLGGCLVLRVQDTGVGIPPARLEAIFESFVQADGSTTRRHDGAGLGLAICRNLVGLMDGEIEVESEEQVGTTFTVTIPTRPAHEPSAAL
jgi:signal transduction histidine kinase